MAIALSNTHTLVGRLKESGFTEQQAEAITEVIQEIDLSGIATRNDLTLGLEGIKSELRTEIERAKVTLIQWMVTLLIAQSALVVAVIELLKS